MVAEEEVGGEGGMYDVWQKISYRIQILRFFQTGECALCYCGAGMISDATSRIGRSCSSTRLLALLLAHNY